MKNIERMIAIALLITVTTGCAAVQTKQSRPIEGTAAQEPKKQNIEYEVPPNQPHVFVNQVGYETKSTKVAIFNGKDLKNTFEVIDAESGEAVFTGEIKQGEFKEDSNTYTNYGSFTELDQNGTYYIQTPVIGRSYPFIIGDHLYLDLLPKMSILFSQNRAEDRLEMKGIGKEETTDVSGGWYTGEGQNKNVTKACSIAANLLLAYELYPEAFSDDTGIPESGNKIPDILDEVKYETEWLLKMQNTKGAIYGGIADTSSDAKRLLDSSEEATADFAGVMAGFYQVYKEYDSKYAALCLKAAKRAWNALASGAVEYNQEKYFAAAHLYKATGEYTYHSYIKKYTAVTEQDISIDKSREIYGDITYLMTRRKVDTEICKALMDQWMNEAEDIAQKAQADPYFVAGSEHLEILTNMLILSVVGHVITNHEYATVLENHLHYFLGRNEQGISYIEGIGSRHPADSDEEALLSDQPEFMSIFIFMLSEIINTDSGAKE